MAFEECGRSGFELGWYGYRKKSSGSGSPSSDRRHAQQAVLRCNSGELAADRPWAWLAAPRETLRHHIIDAYLRLADGLSADEALPLLGEAVTLNPYNQHLHHRLVTALVKLGDHDAADRLREAYDARLLEAGLLKNDDH
ncbi:bacterial transcriptional activator domain-containing protein [Actinoplanes sp. NPDC051475]|uniref:bacterial transcriptional activator domain-containing protein n=1 Tax=Actinoplanes sp. NPDC051475 TaxID=3157225 RepID=UPI00344C0227